MFNPDVIDSDNEQGTMFAETEHPLAQPADWDSDGLNLFLRIHQLSLRGLGTVNYGDCTFRFSHAISKLIDANENISLTTSGFSWFTP